MRGRSVISMMRTMLATLILLIAFGARAYAETLFVTSLSGQQVLTADTVTNAVTPVFNTVGQPDSLIFDGTGSNIIYTNLGTGQVREFNRSAKTDTVLASGFADPADLALEPGGATTLVSNFGGGTISRVNLATHAVTTLGNYGGNPQGLAYDALGNLFAVLGTRSGGATSFVARLDPITGAILGQTVGEVELDGMTYDPFTGLLYSPSLNGNGIFAINPSTLAVTLLNNSTGVAFDGITTDSNGNLFIANSGSRIYQYNLISDVLTPETTVSGLDDLAPASGLGAPVPAPAIGRGLPALLAISGAWILHLVFLRLRCKPVNAA
jgi:hypothetical protein